MKRLLPYDPPLLLCLVASVQVYLVRSHDLSEWRGGGFGMFSTNDDFFRRIEAWVSGPAGERPIDTARRMGVATFPTEERLRKLGRRIGEAQRKRGEPIDRVRIAATTRDFDPVTLEPRRVVIREVVVPLDPVARGR